jgi:hypothetical protein
MQAKGIITGIIRVPGIGYDSQHIIVDGKTRSTVSENRSPNNVLDQFLAVRQVLLELIKWLFLGKLVIVAMRCNLVATPVYLLD